MSDIAFAQAAPGLGGPSPSFDAGDLDVPSFLRDD